MGADRTRRVADVELRLYWDRRAKRWTVTAHGVGHSFWKRAETTAEIGQVEARLLVDTIIREMESWLA